MLRLRFLAGLVVSFIAATRFPVGMSVAGVAFAPGIRIYDVPIQVAAKLGTLLNVLAGPLTFVVARLLGVRCPE